MRRLHTQAKLALPEGGTRTASAGRRADAAGALRDRAAALAGVADMESTAPPERPCPPMDALLRDGFRNAHHLLRAHAGEGEWEPHP